MNTKIKTISLMLSVIALGFTACQDKAENVSIEEIQVLEVESDGVSTLDLNSYEKTVVADSGTITEEEINGLLLMREEEKMAHDLYTMFNEAFELRIFERISRSELTHTSAVLRLLSYYGIEDPASEEAGVFNNVAIQELYDALLEEGLVSVENAIVVGLKVEEYDILDLMGLLENTENEQVKFLYTNLLRGSRNHLRAFYRQLDIYDIVYYPTFLDFETFEEIVTTPHEQGLGVCIGAGNGNGGHGGNGNGNGGNGNGNGGNGGNGGGGNGGGC